MSPLYDRLNRRFLKLQIRWKQRMAIYEAIAYKLQDGLPPVRIIDILWQAESDGGRRRFSPVAVMLNDWRRRMTVTAGATLAEAVRPWVPEHEYRLIAAGEAASGRKVTVGDLKVSRLSKSLLAIIDMGQAKSEMMSSIIGVSVYPVLMLATVLSLLIGLSTTVLPNFKELVDVDELTGMGHLLILVSQNITSIIAAMLALLVGGAVFIAYSLPRNWFGRWRQYIDRVPPWSFSVILQEAYFISSLAALKAANVDDITALRRLRVSANPWLAHRIELLARLIEREGVSIGTAFVKARLGFPSRDVSYTLRSFENSGNFIEAMERIGKRSFQAGIARLKLAVSVLPYVSMVVIFLMVGSILLGVNDLRAQILATAGRPVASTQR